MDFIEKSIKRAWKNLQNDDKIYDKNIKIRYHKYCSIYGFLHNNKASLYVSRFAWGIGQSSTPLSHDASSIPSIGTKH